MMTRLAATGTRVANPRLLFVAEGDPESWNSWSGCSRSLLGALRSAGLDVRSRSADLPGIVDALVKAVSFVPDRSRWTNRYHLSPIGHAIRSHRVRAKLQSCPDGIPVLQVGASFSAFTGDRALYAICDANVAFAASAGAYGPVARLSKRDLQAAIAMERTVYERCSLIFAFTERLRRSFIEDFGVPAHSVITTFQGANLVAPPSDVDVASSLKSADPRILFVGRMFERKGGPTLLRAFREVRRRFPSARLQVVGCTPDVALEAGVDVFGLLSREPGASPSLRDLYLGADLFCLPTRYEPFGTSFVEAMLHGLPCVGTREWSSEVIAHGEDGWLVGVDDHEELANILIEALSDRERLRTMGHVGRAKARKQFSWNRVADTIHGHIGR